MILNESLEKFGLTPRESRVYLASLELGRATVQEIAKKAELPRSTTYSVLESLIGRNLVFPLKNQKIKQYSAEDPVKIINLSEESTRALKIVLPELKFLYRTSYKNRPKIKYHEGISAIKEMYDDILRQKGLREYLIFAAEKQWLEMDKQWFEEFKKRRASAKIKTRLIVEDSEEARQRQKDGMKYLSEVKILLNYPAEKWSAGVYIFWEKVIFVEYKKDLIAVEVHSAGIARLLRMMFESVWITLK